MEINDITSIIIKSSIEVHKHLEPGLLESAYEECLCYEMKREWLSFEKQKPLPVIYKDIKLECGYRLDVLVEDLVILELKSVECLAPIHEAQMLTYLKFAKKKVGLLINFNETKLINGLRRFIL